ncbi:MAG TPA: YetF domain-containing protein [Tepidisphaeraceae bacterium]|jgi:uncharacterized membrane protein YcaP (DUF421 family)
MWQLSFPWWQFIIRGAVVYIAVLILIRISGKRQVAQMGIIEFVALLLISNAVQNSMNGGDNSITGGIILAVTLLALTHLLAVMTYRSDKCEHLIQGEPTLLIRHGKFLDANLRKELLSHEELKAMLRRQGIHRISEIDHAILESDGYLSVQKIGESANEPEISTGVSAS